jgi:hypothetical protein
LVGRPPEFCSAGNQLLSFATVKLEYWQLHPLFFCTVVV